MQRIIRFMVLVATAAQFALVAVAAEDLPAPRSSGSVFHVDFEAYMDGLVGVLDAGVRWLGDPFTDIKQNKAEVLNDPSCAFSGSRCAFLFTDALEQRSRIVLQARFDAAETRDEVVEFVFRPVRQGAADLKDFVLWAGAGRQSGRAGATLYANGNAGDGTYSIDIEFGEPATRAEDVVSGLKQSEWTRCVLARNSEPGTVDLWIGPPQQERWIGRFPDLAPERRLWRAELGDLSEEGSVGSGYWDDIRLGGALAEGDAVAPAETLRDLRDEAPDITYPLPVGPEKLLFVDDAAVETMAGLDRTLHSPVKREENPLLIPEEPWETNGRFFVPFDVLREGEKLRVWYGCYRKSDNKLTFTCVADSTDGTHWDRPRLGLYDFEGSKDNNIVWQGRGVKPNFDPRDTDPSRRYKGMTRVNGFTPVFSPDGIHWTAAGAAAIEQAYDASTVHWDPVDGKWIASCKIWRNGKRSRGYAESRDYVNWSDTYPMLFVDEMDQPQDELYAMRIFRYETLYLGLLKVYHVATDRCDIQLATSRNGRQWQRPWREPFLANSPEPGACDYGNLDEAGDPIQMGDELWFFYGGRSILHNEPPPDTNGSLCAATLRLDGFVSLDAKAEEGSLVTRPLLLRGKRLFMNADASRGEIRVEVLEGRPEIEAGSAKNIEGFAKADCVPVRSDNVRHGVVWSGHSDVEALANRPVRLRILLQNARLFGIWCD